MDTDSDIDAELNRPRFVMMNGTSGAGKTRWISEFLAKPQRRDWTVISFDDIRAEFAASRNIDVNKVLNYPEYLDECINTAFSRLAIALRDNKNIILDSTMVLSDQRQYLLEQVKTYGRNYHTTSVDIMLSEEEQEERLKRRNAESGGGLKIDLDKAKAYFGNYIHEPSPSIDEGFDLVLQVPSPELKESQWKKTIAGTFTGPDRFK